MRTVLSKNVQNWISREWVLVVGLHVLWSGECVCVCLCMSFLVSCDLPWPLRLHACDYIAQNAPDDDHRRVQCSDWNLCTMVIIIVDRMNWLLLNNGCSSLIKSTYMCMCILCAACTCKYIHLSCFNQDYHFIDCHVCTVRKFLHGHGCEICVYLIGSDGCMPHQPPIGQPLIDFYLYAWSLHMCAWCLWLVKYNIINLQV